MLIDTHAHIHYEPLINEIDDVIARAKANGVEKIITIGTTLADSYTAVELADKYSEVYASVGVHPSGSLDYKSSEFDSFKILAEHKKVLAIGEIGLDYHYEETDSNSQKDLFNDMLQLSIEVKLPVVIHNRDATKDCIDMLNSNLGGGKSNGGILHCFNGDKEILKWALDNGFYISYAGNTTYKSALVIQNALDITPRDRLLVETDCPYLAPVPKRSKPNEPSFVLHTYEFIAKRLGINIKELETEVEANFKRLFKF